MQVLTIPSGKWTSSPAMATTQVKVLGQRRVQSVQPA